MSFDGRGGYGQPSREGRRSRRGRGQGRGSLRSAQRSANAPGGDSHSAYGTGGQAVTRENSGRQLSFHQTGADDHLNVTSHERAESPESHQSQQTHGSSNSASGLASAAKLLMKLSRNDHNRRAQNPAQLRDLVLRLNDQLEAADPGVCPKELSDIAFALGKLGKLQFTDAGVMDLLKNIADIAKYQVDSFSPHDIAGIVSGFASLSVRNEALMSVMAAEVVSKITDFDQWQLSNTAWAFAKCALWNEQLASAIVSECLAKLSTFHATSLSQISWAMAQWGTKNDELMDMVASEVFRKTSEFAPSPLAMTAWSYSSLQLKNAPLMAVISQEVTAKISHFKTQDLSNVAWAFANLRMQDQPLFNIMEEEVQSKIKGALPADLSGMAWAFSKNSCSHESLLHEIAVEATKLLYSFKPAEIATLTWAYAVAGMQEKPLMHEIGVQVARQIDRFSAPQLSHVVWAFGALSLQHSKFLQTLSPHVQRSVDTFKAQGLSNIAWALAMVAWNDEPLLRRMAPVIAQGISELRPLALARCAWAYRALAVHSPDLVAALSEEALQKVEQFPTKALVKLVDSMYIGAASEVHNDLEQALGSRMVEVSNFLRETWPSVAEEPAGGTAVEGYASQLRSLGMLDCGLVGTPLLLSQLGIGLPSLGFLRKCRSQEWAKLRVSEEQKAGFKEFTVAKVEVTALENTLLDWVVYYSGEGAPDVGEPDNAAQRLMAVDLPGRSGRAEATYLVLSDICTRIFNLGVQPDSSTACASVKGSVQLLSTVLPCVSSIGALHQFAALFPNVVLEFAEQVVSN